MNLTKEEERRLSERLARMSSAKLKALANLNNSFVPNLKRLKAEEKRSKKRRDK